MEKQTTPTQPPIKIGHEQQKYFGVLFAITVTSVVILAIFIATS